MPTVHFVQQGEHLTSIAKKYGFASWDKIYSHPDNANFRDKRPNKFVIRPGDRIVIPDPESRTESGGTESKHRFRLRRKVPNLRLKLRNFDGGLLVDEPYQLTIGNNVFEGRTDSDGLLEHPLYTDEEQGIIKLLGRDMSLPLKIGHLDPISDADNKKPVVSGVQDCPCLVYIEGNEQPTNERLAVIGSGLCAWLSG